jgi:phospholipid/cholesterol/gamma-HCH transport system substrate-binding protein
MEYRRSEIRAGIFLLLAFAILVVMVFAVSDIQSLFKKKKDIKVLFAFSDGIEKNAQVRLSGIKIGKVTAIRVAPEHRDNVELTLSIFSDTVLKQDAKAAIKSLGLVGGKYVELSGGSPQAQTLDPDSRIIGEESLKLEDLTKVAVDMVGKLDNIATNVDRLLGDPVLTKSIRTTIRNLQDVSSNIRSVSSNILDVSSDVKVMTSSKEEVAQTLKNLPELLKKVDASVETLKEITDKTDKLVGDNRKNVDATMENMKEITNNLKELTEDVKKHPWKLIRKP